VLGVGAGWLSYRGAAAAPRGEPAVA
jgi:hypothetical protein